AGARVGFAHSAEARIDLTNVFGGIEGRAPDMAELAGLQNTLAGTTLAGTVADLAARRATGFATVAGANGDISLTATTKPEAFDFTGTSFGAATITGFDPSQDAILLHAGPARGSAGGAFASGDGAVIPIGGGGSLTLAGVDPGRLTAANFH